MNERMKTINRIAILCSLALAALACGRENVPPDPVEPDTPVAETRTLTFVFPEFTLGEGGAMPAGIKTGWAPGDQIVIHGEYAKDQVTVTLESGDIQADGKTASKTVEGLYPYVREDCTSVLYASYPASAVDNLKHCFFYSKFSTTNAPIMAACNSGDTFQFQNISNVITFTLDGNYEAYQLSTPKKDAIGYEFLQVKLTDAVADYKQYVGDPVLQIEGGITGKEVNIYVPEGTAFKAGFSLKLKKGGHWVSILKDYTPREMTRSTVVNLGNITDRIEAYEDPFEGEVADIDVAGNANCYIVTAPGTYKFKAVYGNKSVQYLEDVDNAFVLWETWNDDSEVTPGSVVEYAAYAEDFIIFRTPTTLKPGNAVIAAKGLNGEILWSWHIWIPATAVETASYGNVMGADVMDRNLGALVATKADNASVDPRSYGMVYQWGRKDPFTAAGVFKGEDPATCAGEPEEVAEGQITLADAIAHPRLLGHTDDGNWIVLADLDNYLWSDTEKTIYDPCPAGYRVPAKDGAAPFWSDDLTSKTGWSVSSEFGWLTLGSPAAVFPIAGYRDDYSVGGMAKVGTRTLFWVSGINSDSKAACADLRYDKGTFKFGAAPKARLGSVRCVVETVQ
jgi:hypothetical protein